VSLRTRLLLALLATSAVTLGAAALALLSPLQQRLDEQGRDSVRAAALATRDELSRELIADNGFLFNKTIDTLNTLAQRTDARLALYDGILGHKVYDLGITDPGVAQLRRALATGYVQSGETRDGAGVVVPLNLARFTSDRKLDTLAPERQYFLLELRKPDTGGEAVDTVRSAFLTAALIGLLAALLLGAALSTGLSRRLGRLRRSAQALAVDAIGAPAPIDTAADEVGDLARALASMQRALRRQEEARRAFVATASHELRTPLTSLQGNLELLAEDLESGTMDPDEAREQLRGAQGQLRRLTNLASELLDLSRLDAGVELRREPVELGELTRAVAAEFTLRARDRGVDVDVATPPGPVWAGGDPGAIARVVRILLDNALRFSPPHELVQIEAAYHGDRATLAVTDAGPGVPPEERDVIFERFTRGSRTGGEGGFGLGLAIGRELARRLDGELALEPRDGAPGARFVLTLPIELPRGSGEEGEGPSAAGPAGPEGAGEPSVRA
jgi:signal transduction histidine kinase